MAKIFFNDKAVKTEKETTILNWFSQADGVTIFVRDTRPETYIGGDFIRADIDTYSMGGDYYLDFIPSKKLDSMVLGLFISEGSDFTISTGGIDPLFVVKQTATVMSLGMMPSMNKGFDAKEVAMGVFFKGAVISYQLNGYNISDKLTDNGWIRLHGPANDFLGILSTHEAYSSKLKDDANRESRELADIVSLKKALLRDDVDKSVVRALIKSKEDQSERSLHIFLRDDIAILKKKGII